MDAFGCDESEMSSRSASAAETETEAEQADEAEVLNSAVEERPVADDEEADETVVKGTMAAVVEEVAEKTDEVGGDGEAKTIEELLLGCDGTESEAELVADPQLDFPGVMTDEGSTDDEGSEADCDWESDDDTQSDEQTDDGQTHTPPQLETNPVQAKEKEHRKTASLLQGSQNYVSKAISERIRVRPPAIYRECAQVLSDALLSQWFSL